MAQTPPPIYGNFVRALAGGRPLIATILCVCACTLTSLAQGPAAVLIQGPSSKKTLRVNPGEAIEWRLRGESELWRGTLVAVYPEAKALRINDLLLQLSDIEGVRYMKREGFKDYIRIQGIVNLGVIGLVSAFDANVRNNQRGFVIGAAATSAVMVVVGSVDRYAKRRFGPSSRYKLVIVGGAYRVEEEAVREVGRRY